ncbi:hypothetical protein HRbin36_01403 [bacterium HR36]|nr:hypothetical protein HRbin36_01403 [bacterium HR36]
MHRLTLIIFCGLLAAWPVHAGIFGKKAKPTPQRVSELVGILLNHPESNQRAEAAEELANADAGAHPEVLHALIEALRKDGSSTVRRAAASSLGKLQPPTREAADALDQAIKHDDSWTVRMQARMARLGYRVPRPSAGTANPPGTPSLSPAQGKPIPFPAAKPVPALSFPQPASPNNSHDLHPPLPPGVHPSQLELAPPPRLQAPAESDNRNPSRSIPLATTAPVNASSPAAGVSTPTLVRPTRASKPTSSAKPSPRPDTKPTSSNASPTAPPVSVPPQPSDSGPILVPPQ